MAVFNFGSINIDHVYTLSHFVNPGETIASSAYESILGGKGANQSVACAKAGLNTYHVGSIHQNDASMLTPMTDANVDMQFVKQQSQIASGHAIIQVNDEGENAIILYPGANHSLTNARILEVLEHAKADDWVLLQNETNAVENIIESAHAANLQVAFNPAPMTDAIQKIDIQKLSLLIVNEVEAMQLTKTNTVDDARNALLTLSNTCKILLTLGKKGVCYIHNEQLITADAFKVDAIDTTAAGDTFIGFFMAMYSKSNQDDASIKLALRTACAASAISVTRKGASPSIPSMDEVETFLKNNS